MQTLKDLRIAAGKSRSDVAIRLDVTPQAVRHYENGIRQINITQVLLLAELFDCSAEDIIFGQLNSHQKDR